MKTPTELLDGMAGVEPSLAELNDGVIVYLEACQKLHDNSLAYDRHAVEMNRAFAESNDGAVMSKAIQDMRFTLREQGLLMSKAARELTTLSAKCAACSNLMGAVVAPEAGQ
jgi:hypothetical protein